MAYIIDDVRHSKGGVQKDPVVDYKSSNDQAHARAKLTGTAATTSDTTKKAGTNTGGDYGTGTSGGSSFDLQAYLSSLQAAAQARAQAAYDRNMSRIASAYDSASGSLGSNYDSAVERLNAARAKSYGDINSDAEDSLRQAYINNMLTKKNLNQRLSAMGYNGGATESTMASLANQYGSSRTDINNTRNDNLADLEQTYGDNLASALQAYNSAMSDLNMQRMQLEMQAENALQSAESGLDSNVMSLLTSNGGYLSALENALANQGAYSYDTTSASNTYNPASTTQASTDSTGSNYAKILAQAQLMSNQGYDSNSISNYLAQNSGGNVTTLAMMLQQLGL